MDNARQQKMLKAYETGKNDCKKYNNDMAAWAWDGNEPSWDDLLDAAWEAGWYDRDCPIAACGWRYGNVPEKGKSWNNREQRLEPGISMMYVKTVDGEEYGTKDMVSAEFVRCGRSRIDVAGWLVGFGGDGEPCLLK